MYSQTCVQAALAIQGSAFRGFDNSHLISLEPNLCLCSKPGLAFRGFAIHIQIFLKLNPSE